MAVNISSGENYLGDEKVLQYYYLRMHKIRPPSDASRRVSCIHKGSTQVYSEFRIYHNIRVYLQVSGIFLSAVRAHLEITIVNI